MAIEDLGGGNVRKCMVKKWSDFSGYGFNLHAEKGKAGQYIGKVDAGSPADAAGLKEGDRIVEVNDVNIGNENHQQVVTRIKSGGDSVWLLVVDKAGDAYCKNNKVIITADLDGVKVIECPDSRHGVPASSVNNENDSNASTAEVNEPPPENDYETPADLPPPASGTAPETSSMSDEDDEDLPPPPPELVALDAAVNSVSAEPAAPESNAPEPEEEAEEVKVEVPEPEEPVASPAQAPEEPLKPEEPEKPAEPAAQNGSTANSSAEAVPKMSAAEMREALAKKKRNDPRNSKLSAKDKLKMFQNL